MATISDVARQAGVSMKTVSRVLNREPHVRPALRDRVEEAVRTLDYRPNLAARQLAGSRSFLIAYPFNNPSPSYITEVLMGAARACTERGYHLVSEPVDFDEGALPVIVRLVEALRPDGMILTPPLGDWPAVIDRVEQLGVPLVRIAGVPHGYGDSIVINDRGISQDMVRHLVAQGHRRIAFIMPHPDHALAQARFGGYIDGLLEARIAPEPTLIRPGRFDVESGAQAARDLLDLPQPPTAIFAANDDMALGALQVAHDRGLAIPGDVAIAGFDDLPAGRLAWPPLTTVRQPTELLGAMAARMLLGEPLEPDAVRHDLMIRASTLARPPQ